MLVESQGRQIELIRHGPTIRHTSWGDLRPKVPIRARLRLPDALRLRDLTATDDVGLVTRAVDDRRRAPRVRIRLDLRSSLPDHGRPDRGLSRGLDHADGAAPRDSPTARRRAGHGDG